MANRRDWERERGEPAWGHGVNRYRDVPRERENYGRISPRWHEGELAGDFAPGPPADIDLAYGPRPYDDELFGPDWRRERDPHRDAVRESFRGRGPKNYVRSDERISEELNWVLTEAVDVDATNIELAVSNGEVHLRGSVLTRDERARAEELARHVLGVRHVLNELEVRRPDLRRRF